MASSTAATVAQYLDELPAGRAEELRTVLAAVRGALPDGMEEAMSYGMITWNVPLAVYSDTYNRKPLNYAGLAAQKNYSSLYLSAACSCVGNRLDEPAIRARWAGGKPLDMGKSCVRFKRASDLDLPLIAEVLRQWTAAEFVAFAQSQRKG
jgi:hypothetical protein